MQYVGFNFQQLAAAVRYDCITTLNFSWYPNSEGKEKAEAERQKQRRKAMNASRMHATISNPVGKLGCSNINLEVNFWSTFGIIRSSIFLFLKLVKSVTGKGKTAVGFNFQQLASCGINMMLLCVFPSATIRYLPKVNPTAKESRELK